MRVRAALAEAEQRLAAIPGRPRQDAELLMAHALGTTVGEMKLLRLDHPTPAAFDHFLARRLTGEPVAYAVGSAGFWSIDLSVSRGVLIPRADSETLIEAAVEHFGTTGPRTILDLGTGPGTLLLAALAEWPAACGLGIDASEQAIELARLNALDLGFKKRATIQLGDWATGVDGPFDLILCNPPYIESGARLDPAVADWEPHGALFAGPDGLDAYRRIAPDLSRLLASGGVACLEIGEGQADAVGALFCDAPFTISSRRDLRGVVRCLVLSPK